MRVTNALITQSLSSRLLDNQRRLAEAQERVATGKRLQKMSDDPTAGSAIMQVGASLRGIEQYTRNVDHLATRLDAEDSALSQLTDLMTRARELGVATVGANVDAFGRRAAGAELRQLLGQVINIANTKVGEDYVFGGVGNDGRAPFTLPTVQADGTTSFVVMDPPVAPSTTPTPRVPTGERQFEIAAGQTMAGPHAGGKVFLDNGMLDGLHRLATAMESDQPAAMATAMRDLDTAFSGVQALVGEIGARQNQVRHRPGRADRAQGHVHDAEVRPLRGRDGAGHHRDDAAADRLPGGDARVLEGDGHEPRRLPPLTATR